MARQGSGDRRPGTMLAAMPVTGKAGFDIGERVFHQKFGMGNIRSIEGDKLDIDFEEGRGAVSVLLKNHSRHHK